MIEQLFGETASFSKSPSDTMSETTIISLYSYRMCFSNHMIICLEGFAKTLPIIRTDTSERNTQFEEFLSESSSRF
ncbi:hypothetical protein EZS27_030645 [termite gut metagenome]|uniref:Uncharacterized protein n=1 Tax=termite gut metagenome TaxID=433724 RepID=A0A5J4QFV0_9ZZZZ